MPKAAEIISAISVETGITMDEVTEVARRLREQPPGGELWVRETRSPQSPRATPRHCANLLGALLADHPAKHVGKTIAQMQNSLLEGESLKHVRQYPPFEGPLRTLQTPQHNFIDAIESIIKEATQNLHLFGEIFKYTSISFEKITFEGTIILQIHDKFNQLISGERGVDVILNYSNSETFHDGDFFRESRIGIKAIARIGRLLAKDDL